MEERTAEQVAPINFDEVRKCWDCSEKWGFCAYHQEKYGIDYAGNQVTQRIQAEGEQRNGQQRKC